MIGRLLGRLDTFGLDDPDANELHPEDRCPICSRPVMEHVGRLGRFGHAGRTVELPRAKWPHRRAAAVALLLG